MGYNMGGMSFLGGQAPMKNGNSASPFKAPCAGLCIALIGAAVTGISTAVTVSQANKKADLAAWKSGQKGPPE